ncbi:Capsular polysaccharide export system inner membrane protein KpsE [Candidatus Burkholderia verschuerenii]|uniref:Capsular polysaccharide export system inner membrane protein KpsE n=1 Tax=Candidatus Burkholderia verschuerenii TaxID=242163 RepID=A0A0L0M399_9BURK|nr:sugar ABC transporter [Candidatus Burkholderia verschuerenii]KND57102.1 Capsular polysaccharide export system inner membrane protein KpsE [Candidatus Burkholderia verschuerenii]
METASSSEPEAGIDARRRERAAAIRTRRFGRWIMLALILAPVVLGIVYASFVAMPRYSAEARFSVRASASQSPVSGAVSLLTSGDGGGLGTGFVDGWAVSDFLNSRDCMQQLDKKIGLRQKLTRGGFDVVNRLPADASEDDLYRAYRSTVKVSYNMMEQVDVMTVRAFSPADAALISNALIELAQNFVNRMDERGVEDAFKVSRQAVALAQQKAQDARTALTRWRVSNQNLDPAANAAMLLNLSGQIETELNTAQLNLDKIRALGNPDHPMLAPSQAQVAALKQRLAEVRQRMSGTGNTQATQLERYEQLKNAQTFADSNLNAAQQGYQQAFTDTHKLQRYLTVISKPLPSDRPTSPDTLLLMIEALAIGLALALFVKVAAALARAFRHG